MSGAKTEQPTPKRLRESRQKGEVFKSLDLTHALLFFAAAIAFSFAGKQFFDELKAFTISSFDSRTLAGTPNPDALVAFTATALLKFFALSAPLLVGLFLMAAAGNFAQVGSLFAGEVLGPKFERLNPFSGFQNLFFKPRSYIEFVKTLVKLIVILWLAYSTVQGLLQNVLMSGHLPATEMAALAGRLITNLLFKCAVAFVFIGVADYAIQRRLHMKELMMSKEDVIREHKQEEGDPHIKHRRRQLHRELLAQNIRLQVPLATAVVVNPTHLAIALRYDENTMNAPEVAAKGQEKIALEIIEIAKKHNVPIVRNIPLAHSLYELEPGVEIPEELFDAAAEILNWVYELRNTEAAS